jgi:4-diphosphocytidyl-2-C-methyl-D-erythritol kinase
MRVRAFAKINLSLRVIGPRRDGYHDVRTIMQSIALHDTLTIRRTRGAFALTCDEPACPTGRTNLVWRAAERVWKRAGHRGAPRGVTIHLAKRIPMLSGLGGGSSDAAAAIRVLGKLWHVRVAPQVEIAASLGADIPYFFEGGTVLGLDRGDLLFPLQDRLPAWVVLVLPAFGISTREAYEWFDTQRPGRRPPARRFPGRGDSAEGLAARNDLEPVVIRHHPEIARIVAALWRRGASEAAMSGSGSAVYGLFRDRLAAIRAAAAVSNPRRRTLVTRTLNRRVYQRLAAN